MPYLTRFHLDPRSRAGARYLENPQRLHAALYRATPTQPVDVSDNGRILWRIDRDDPWDPLVWVVSPERPMLDPLADEAGHSVGGRVYESRDYAPLLTRLQKGQVYAFRFTGNPVRTGRRAVGDAESQRFGHVTAAQQTRWFVRQAEAHGFALCPSAGGGADVVVTGRRRTTFWRDRQRVVIAIGEFIGHLEIIDATLARQALVRGIGHARAYGCGLLTLAKPR